ncbi:unnamed protein product [Hymenolepis diminuta]|uniref:Uncharacterized protein n=1 Tax=Hymenolepis diminuta TaxID=6216 RepID=A0A564YNB0_HYMDI|nr:unnamed protein product [Hymenolepis diminuta]
MLWIVHFNTFIGAYGRTDPKNTLKSQEIKEGTSLGIHSFTYQLNGYWQCANEI